MTGRIDAETLQVGDTFYECSGRTNLHMKVTTPVETVSVPIAGDMRTQYKWKAVNLQTQEEIDYLVTKGLEHYGPKMYNYPAYISLADFNERE